jgi:hypothetical protein
MGRLMEPPDAASHPGCEPLSKQAIEGDERRKNLARRSCYPGSCGGSSGALPDALAPDETGLAATGTAAPGCSVGTFGQPPTRRSRQASC